MYISPEDSALLIAASNLVAALTGRNALDQDALVRETVNTFKKLKAAFEKAQE